MVHSSKARLYISSQADLSAQGINQMVRSHWSIENKLHLYLDVTFGEDASRVRTKNAPENLNVMRKLALRKVAKDDSKLSKKKRRFKADINIQYLEKLLRLKI